MGQTGFEYFDNSGGAYTPFIHAGTACPAAIAGGGNWRLPVTNLKLDHDGYAKEQPIVADDGLARIQFTLENRTGGEHQSGLRIAGLPAGEYAITIGGRTVATMRGGAAQENNVALPVSAAATVQVTIATTAR